MKEKSQTSSKKSFFKRNKKRLIFSFILTVISCLSLSVGLSFILQGSQTILRNLLIKIGFLFLPVLYLIFEILSFLSKSMVPSVTLFWILLVLISFIYCYLIVFIIEKITIFLKEKLRIKG